MPTIKLTETAIHKLRPDPQGGQLLYWDTELKGFGVLVGRTGTKTYVVQRKLANGNRRRVSVAPAAGTTLAAARVQAGAIIGQFFQGVDPKAQRRAEARASASLQAVLDQYLAGRKNLSANTQTLYRAWITGKLTAWLDLPLRAIIPDMVDDRYHQIGRDNPATANAVFRVFRLLWNFQADRDPGMPERSPTRRLRGQWYDIAARENIVKADDLPLFFRTVNGLPNRVARDYVMLLLFSGLRLNEAAALRWSEVDFAGRVIRLGAARTKSSRQLNLPMSSFIHSLLVARRAIGDAGGWVFPSRNSKAGHITSPLSILQTVTSNCGIKVTVHDLRRTFITIAESCDISPLALKALVGHSFGNDVTSGYVRMTSERLREPAERVCQRLVALCEIEPVGGGTVAPARVIFTPCDIACRHTSSSNY
jgi:integrase